MLSTSIGTCFLVHYKEPVLTLFYQITFAQILLRWSISAENYHIVIKPKGAFVVYLDEYLFSKAGRSRVTLQLPA
jgi:hypothetical protein